MPSIEDVIKDPEFYSLPKPERIKVMQAIDKDFSALPMPEQSKVIETLATKFSGSGNKVENISAVSASGRQPMGGPAMGVSHEQPQAKQPLWPIRQDVAQDLWRRSEPLVRMGIEGGAMTAAGLASLPLGPAGIVPAEAGAYMASKQAADSFQNMMDKRIGLQPSVPAPSLESLRKDATMGTGLALGGQLLAPAISGVSRAAKWGWNKGSRGFKRLTSKQATEAAAGKEFTAESEFGTIYAKNADEAAEIEKEIPGLKFSMGQRTSNAAYITKERALARSSPERGEISTQFEADNTEALRGYWQRKFGGGEGIEDALPAIQSKAAKLKLKAEQSQIKSDEMLNALQSKTPTETGEKIVGLLEKREAEARALATSKYNKVPEDLLSDDTQLVKRIKEIVSPIDEYEGTENVPKILETVLARRGAKDAKPTTINDLRRLESRLKTEIRDKTKPFSNTSSDYIKRLRDARRAVEETILSTGSGGNVGRDLREAHNFYREEVIGKFKGGVVGKILAKGQNGQLSAVPTSEIPNRIFQSGAKESMSDSFINAVGVHDAGILMRDHASWLLKDAATDKFGNITAKGFSNWFAKNKRTLKKFGISKHFDSVKKAQIAADFAAENAIKFEHSAASKILNADVSKAIETAIKATKGENMREAASSIMSAVEGNPVAEAGVQKAFADFLETRMSSLTARTAKGDPKVLPAQLEMALKKYAPAIDVLFRNSPEKKKALDTVRNAYLIHIRARSSPLGGGSDTAENIANAAKGLNILNRYIVLAKGIARIFEVVEKSKMDDILTRAMFDSDYAKKITDLYYKTYKPGVPKIKIKENSRIVVDDLYRQLNRRKKEISGIAYSATGGAYEQ